MTRPTGIWDGSADGHCEEMDMYSNGIVCTSSTAAAVPFGVLLTPDAALAQTSTAAALLGPRYAGSTCYRVMTIWCRRRRQLLCHGSRAPPPSTPGADPYSKGPRCTTLPLGASCSPCSRSLPSRRTRRALCRIFSFKAAAPG